MSGGRNRSMSRRSAHRIELRWTGRSFSGLISIRGDDRGTYPLFVAINSVQWAKALYNGEQCVLVLGSFGVVCIVHEISR